MKFLQVASVLLLFMAVFSSSAVFASSGFSGAGQAVPAVMYHKISADKSEHSDYCISPQALENDFIEYKKAGFTPITVSELCELTKACSGLDKTNVMITKEYLNASELVRRYPNPLLITFDDGYKDGYSIVFPLLKKYNIKANFFTVGMFSEQGGDFLTPFQIKEMSDSGLAEFGNHTYSIHEKTPEQVSLLVNAADSENMSLVRDDYIRNNELLSQWTGKQTVSFSYPYGISSCKTNAVLSDMGIKVSFLTASSGRLLKLGEPTMDIPRVNRCLDFDSRELVLLLIDKIYAQIDPKICRDFNSLLENYRNRVIINKTSKISEIAGMEKFYSKHRVNVSYSSFSYSFDCYFNTDGRAIASIGTIAGDRQNICGAYDESIVFGLCGKTLTLNTKSGTAECGELTIVLPVVLQNHVAVREIFELAGFYVSYDSCTGEINIYK